MSSNIPKLDSIILNAGIGGWSGINWPKAIYQVLTDPIQSVTWPEFKLSPVGRLAKPQLAPPGGDRDASEPPSSNAYGHSKRLTDLMALTVAGQPATAKMVDSYCETEHKQGANGLVTVLSKPSIYVAQPGIVGP